MNDIKNNFMKRSGRVFFLIASVLFLTACGQGKDQGEKKADSEFGKAHIFREESFEVKEEDIRQFRLAGDRLYIDSVLYQEAEGQETSKEETDEGLESSEEAMKEEEIDQEISDSTEEPRDIHWIRTVATYDLEGNRIGELSFKLPANADPGPMTADEEGNLYSCYTSYEFQEDGSSVSRVYLQKMTAEGEELFLVWLNEEQEEGSYYYVSEIYCLSGGRIVVDSPQTADVFDADGQLVHRIVKEESDTDSRLYRIRDGRFVVVGMSGKSIFYQPIDVDTGTIQEKVDFPFAQYAYTMWNGVEYDLYLSDEKGIYGYNLGEDKPTPIVDFLGSDLSQQGINQVVFEDKETFWILYYHEMGLSLGRFVHIPESQVVEKAELTLGCYYPDTDLKNQVVKFNKENYAYRIRLIDYSEYNTDEDHTLGMSRLNSDIASGNVPDIVALQSGMPVESYMAKGVFVDYYELMEEDEEFKKEDYLQNLFEAYELEGKLYQMVPCFSVMSFAAKTADVGEEFHWSMDEALKLQASRPEGTVLFSDIIQHQFLYQCLLYNSEEYINWETGECFFDSPRFIQMMEYAKTLPKEYKPVDYSDQEAFLEMELQHREGRTLLIQSTLTNFRDYGTLKYGTFGEEITFIGFPTGTGIGSTFVPRFNLAISAQGENQQAAWEFVKSFMSDEFQNGLMYHFPAKLSGLEKMEKESWEKPYYVDIEGNKVEYELVYYLGNMEIPGEPLTKEETGAVLKFIKSVERSNNYNQEINNIITEEAEAFFAGQKNAQETVDIIQSRVRIYVNENR